MSVSFGAMVIILMSPLNVAGSSILISSQLDELAELLLFFIGLEGLSVNVKQSCDVWEIQHRLEVELVDGFDVEWFDIE